MVDRSDQEELADKVVALGVGEDIYEIYRCTFPHSMDCAVGAFLDDWRVAGALMEKCLNAEIVLAHITDEAMRNLGDSLPRAITEAAVEALL